MWRSYSQDLRGRVLAAVDGGMAARPAARLFQVSVSDISKAPIRRRTTGEAGANPNRGHRPRKLSARQERALATRIQAESRTSRWRDCRTGCKRRTGSG